MKKASDPRHIRRIKIMQELFSLEFGNKKKPSWEAAKIIKAYPQIDKVIAAAAPEWPVNKINKVDLAILRLSVFELIMEKEQPFKVIIDEAVELAKKFGSEKSSAFINGALGNIISTNKIIKD